MSYRPTRGGAGGEFMQAAPLTATLIAANVAVYLLQRQNANIEIDYGVWGPGVAAGDWWRLLTGGFLHASVLHIGSNMLALFFVGRALEPALGSLRLGLIYFVSLAAGSLGVIVLDPEVLSIGASGAIFGLMGAFVIFARSRGVSPMESGVGPVILLNLVITFTIPGISIGGHLGGLAGGAAITAVMVELERRRRSGRGDELPFVAIALTAFLALLVISVALARSKFPGA